MPFDFASAKAVARRAVNTTFGVQAFYSDDSIDLPIETRARWHNRKAEPIGDVQDGTGYLQIAEGIDRIVLIPEDLEGNPLTLQVGGIFTFPDILPGVRFELDHEEPATGPLEQAWAVTRKK